MSCPPRFFRSYCHSPLCPTHSRRPFTPGYLWLLCVFLFCPLSRRFFFLFCSISVRWSLNRPLTDLLPPPPSLCVIPPPFALRTMLYPICITCSSPLTSYPVSFPSPLLSSSAVSARSSVVFHFAYQAVRGLLSTRFPHCLPDFFSFHRTYTSGVVVSFCSRLPLVSGPWFAGLVLGFCAVCDDILCSLRSLCFRLTSLHMRRCFSYMCLTLLAELLRFSLFHFCANSDWHTAFYCC